MDKKKAKILMLVEGDRTDVKLMEHLLFVYGIDKRHQIVSYNTNIYALYNQMFRDTEPETVDLLQLLKAKEKDPEKKKIFDERYSDILLIFDLDPQDDQFSEEKIIEMTEYFCESSDMGRLYLNYPMVEAFYHMKSIPDEDYNFYTASLVELENKRYKTRVSSENRNHDYRKFAVNKRECDIVIRQNIEKSWMLVETDREGALFPSSLDILQKQLKKLREEHLISVLCTCAFYIPEYNSGFIYE